MGYTAGSRTGIFAHRAAPIQVSWLGFPATMGASFIDCIIADDFVVPDVEAGNYAERVVRLPVCFQANDADRPAPAAPPVRADAGLPAAGFVFCCFNAVYKVGPRLFDAWMRILRRVPGSVLWLVVEHPIARENLRREATRRGVEAERIVFAPRLPYARYLAQLALADLFVDTLPFNAGTTASDALWMGVPVLTCTGEAYAARMAGSLLRTVGLPELVTTDLAQYEELAVELASDAGRLTSLRARLRRDGAASSLFDTTRFARDLEAVLARLASGF